MRPAGYAGKLGYASAGAAADFIVVNMVAEAVSGSKTPKEADGARAEARRALLQGLAALRAAARCLRRSGRHRPDRPSRIREPL